MHATVLDLQTNTLTKSRQRIIQLSHCKKNCHDYKNQSLIICAELELRGLILLKYQRGQRKSRTHFFDH